LFFHLNIHPLLVQHSRFVLVLGGQVKFSWVKALFICSISKSLSSGDYLLGITRSYTLLTQIYVLTLVM
jgi:hypothetical protein